MQEAHTQNQKRWLLNISTTSWECERKDSENARPLFLNHAASERSVDLIKPIKHSFYRI